MYELIHEEEKWVLYVDRQKIGEFETLEEGVQEIEKMKDSK